MSLSWKTGSNLLQELINIRDSYIEYNRKNPYNCFDIGILLSNLIETDLIRKLNEDIPQLFPTEKENLESEVSKYKDQAESIYKWFAYYQDKCKILEKKTGKFVIPEFPDEEYPARSSPLKF